MAATQLNGKQVLDGTVTRADLDTITVGSAVIRRLIAGSGVSLTSTGVETGTGDVTVDAVSPLSSSTIASWQATNAPAGSSFGATFTTIGTTAAQPPVSTNLLTAARRIRYTSAAAANSAAGIRSEIFLTRGFAARIGGFRATLRFNLNTNTAGHRAFVGLGANAALAAEPSSLLNILGIGFDSTDPNTGNWFLYANDGTGTATRTTLTQARDITSLLTLTLDALPFASAVQVKLVNDTTGVTVFDAPVTVDLPVNTAFVGVQAQVNTGALLTTAILEVNRLYAEARS